MKKIILPIAALLTISSMTIAKGAKKDPVIMKVNGKNVTLSEFEYLYNKNKKQQIESQTPEEYLDLFINYKLKVADAEANGIDTTAAFRDELAQHRQELAKPYLVDTVTENRLVNDIYGHMDRLVDVSHIMLQKAATPEGNDSVKAKLDSLRTAIITGKADFADVAVQWSIDPQAKNNKGNMGWMKANTYPYTFENVAYATPVDSISKVMETPFGFHIIKVNGVKPNPGQVNASHIMKLTRGLSPEETAARKQAIDSIYQVVKNATPEQFADVARRESDDRSSAVNGGQLPWFGVGEMVPTFEATAFATPKGKVSEPFESPYGYHIVMKHDERGVPSFAEAKEAIMRNFSRDDRATMAQDVMTAKYIKKYKGSINDKGIAKVAAEMQKFGATDSAAVAAINAMTKVEVAKVGKIRITANEISKSLPYNGSLSVDEWMSLFNKGVKEQLEKGAQDLAIEELPAQYPDYKHLLGEYRDGILLFDISNTNVWNKALKDEEGLEKFFNDHKADYAKWDKPRFKGIIVFATNDSVATVAHNWLNNNIMADELIPSALRKEFGREVKAERVLTPQGSNPVVDAVAFNGPVPDLSNEMLQAYFVFKGKVIDQPEEARDVRGDVSADYQNELEKAWVKQLREKYPYKVNMEVFKRVK